MRILIAESNKKFARILKKCLTEEYYAVDVCYNFKSASYHIRVTEYDLIILNVRLPAADGFKLCREIRVKNHITPIMMLSFVNNVKDKVKGFEIGSDDYLTVPFTVEEFLVRVKALLRRSQFYKTYKLSVGGLEINTFSREVKLNGKDIRLTGKEYALLEYLMRNKGRVVTHSMIIDHIWNMDTNVASNVVNVFINHLREKIDKSFSKHYIHTVRGVGYKIDEKTGH